ncbi:histone-fold-containing protein [Dichotomocladium elegans]|nr:histone-fold-containing protein [Dichotomocladium elegans]
MKKKYKTKFPVARIKKIMQLDEDVGKVAQATPVLISKALELFMQSLIDQACQEARQRNAKRLSAAHLKKTIETVEQFDFLKDVVANIPDPTETSLQADGEESKPVRRRTKAGVTKLTKQQTQPQDEEDMEE